MTVSTLTMKLQPVLNCLFARVYPPRYQPSQSCSINLSHSFEASGLRSRVLPCAPQYHMFSSSYPRSQSSPFVWSDKTFVLLGFRFQTRQRSFGMFRLSDFRKVRIISQAELSRFRLKWDNSEHTGTMPCRREFSAITRILAFQG